MATRLPPDPPDAGEEDPATRLVTLRRILLGGDSERLDDLERRVRERQRRADDVAEVLPEAFVREFERAPARLSEAVRLPIETTLRDAVRRDPRPIADAIFPVIGPAIRHYVSASIRALAESLSRMIERGLSPRRQLVWRFQAWRAGMRFGDYVLQRTFVYRVEHAYLIQAETGLLIAEAHHDVSTAMDGDAVSGMLSALQSFVLDSFALGEGTHLDTAEAGDFTLWAMHGPYAMLACAIRGVPGADLRGRLEAALENVHLRHGAFLQGWQGSEAPPPPLQQALDECLYLRRADDDEAADAARIGWPAWVLLGALLLLGIRLAAVELGHRQAAARLMEALGAAPGVVVTDIERRGEVLQVRGLRDPLAPPLAALAGEAEIGERRLVDLTRPFQSLEGELVLRRIRQALEPPPSTALRLEGTTLYVSGTATSAWLDRLETWASLSGAVSRVDSSALGVDDAVLLASVRRTLGATPAGITLQVRDGVLQVAGEAPFAWLAQAGAQVREVPGLRGVRFDGAQPVELSQARALVEQIAGAEVMFQRGTADYRDGAHAVLGDVAEAVQRLLAVTAPLGRTPTVTVVGSTDGVGDTATNRSLRIARAERVRDELIARGVPAQVLRARPAQPQERAPAPVEDASLRRTQVQVTVDLGPVSLAPERW